MNKKVLPKVLLVIILLTAILMLSGCSMNSNNLSLGLYQLFGSFIMVVVGFLVSLLSAFVSLLLGIILFVMGIFTTIGGLIGTVLSFFAGLF